MQKSILITGGRSFVALDLARGFDKNNDIVYVADSIPYYITQFSNAITKHFNIPSPAFEFSKFQDTIVNIVKDFKIDIIIPTCEEVFYISKMLDILTKLKCRVITSDFDTLIKLHDKYIFSTISPKSPKSYLIKTKEDLSKFDINNTMVLKPVFSRFGCNVHIGTDFSSIDLKDKSWVLQDFITGTKICTYGYAINGELRFQICYENLSNQTKASTVFYPYQNEKLNSIVRDFLKKLNYTGNISFDIIKSNEDYFFIECNPRVTSGIHNLMSNNFDTLFHSDINSNNDLILQKKKLFFATILYQPKQIITSLFVPDIIFSIKDIKPFLAQNICLFSMINTAYKNKIPLIESTTFDIEYNGGDI